MSETQGWKWLFNTRKWHYFVDGRSLCRKWGTLGVGGCEDTNHDSPDNCKTCRRALEKKYPEKVPETIVTPLEQQPGPWLKRKKESAT